MSPNLSESTIPSSYRSSSPTPIPIHARPKSPPPNTRHPLPTSPPQNPKRTKSFLSRLRRHEHHPAHPSAIPIPMPMQLEQLERSSTKVTSKKEKDSGMGNGNGKQDKKAVKKGGVVLPELTRQVGRHGDVEREEDGDEQGDDDMDEIEWERIKTLPRVRLVPPEDEGGAPITLYPPPHPRKPLLSFGVNDASSLSPPPLSTVFPEGQAYHVYHPVHPSQTQAQAQYQHQQMHQVIPSQSQPQHQQQQFQRKSWTGMEGGFATPTPVFRRTGGGGGFGRSGAGVGGVGGVIMPKKREEVVAGMEMRRRSMVGFEHTLDQVDASRRSLDGVAAGGSGVPVVTESVSNETVEPVNMLDQLDEAVAPVLKDRLEATATPIIATDRNDVNTPPIDMRSTPPAPIVSVSSTPIQAELNSENLARPLPIRSTSAPEQPSRPVELASSIDPSAASTSNKDRPRRKSGAMSFTSHVAAKDTSPSEPAPPLPPLPNALRKQKSLKMFFFSHSTTHLHQLDEPLPPTPPIPTKTHSIQKDEKRPKGLLSRAKSKPSLRIDVKASKYTSSSSSPLTPALATGTTISSPTHPTTPTHSHAEEKPRGLTKRFSLSNMSSAFKKSKSHQPLGGGVVPAVPVLPDAYRRGQGKAKGKVDDGMVKESAVPIGPAREVLPDIPSEESIHQPEVPLPDPPTAAQPSLITTFPPNEPSSAFDVEIDRESNPDFEGSTTSTLSSPISPFIELSSATHTQLQHVSPRTRRDPSVSLQEFLGTAPGPQKGVMVKQRPIRESVEGIILGPLLVDIGHAERGLERASVGVPVGGKGNEGDEMIREGDSLDSLDTIDSPPPITPSCPLPNPLSPPESTQSQNESITPPTQVPNTKPTAGKSTSPTTKRFNSPESFLRKLSPRTSSKLGKTIPGVVEDTKQREEEEEQEEVKVQLVMPPLPPIPVDVGFSALAGDVHLKSLHFDGLGLDFDEFTWARVAADAQGVAV